MKFKQLAIGDQFEVPDAVSGPWVKVGERAYRYWNGDKLHKLPPKTVVIPVLATPAPEQAGGGL